MPKLNKTIDGLVVKGSYEIERSGAVKIDIQEPFAVHDFINPKDDFDIEKYLKELFHLIDVIRADRPAFEKLYNRYCDFDSLLSIQYHKRVFHSETERNAYINDMCSQLGKEFFRLYCELIIPDVKISYDFVLPVPKLIKQILDII